MLGDQEGSDTPPLADILVVQARLRVAQEKLPEAEEDLRRCLRIRCSPSLCAWCMDRHAMA